MENTINERIIQIIEYFKLTVNAFAKNVDVSQTLLFNYTKGRSPSVDFITKVITKYPEISAEWLLIGKGKMLKEKNVEDTNKTKATKVTLQIDIDQEDIKADIIKLAFGSRVLEIKNQ